MNKMENVRITKEHSESVYSHVPKFQVLDEAGSYIIDGLLASGQSVIIYPTKTGYKVKKSVSRLVYETQ